MNQPTSESEVYRWGDVLVKILSLTSKTTSCGMVEETRVSKKLSEKELTNFFSRFESNRLAEILNKFHDMRSDF